MTLDMNKDPPKIKQNMLLRVILTVTLNSTFVFFIYSEMCYFKKFLILCTLFLSCQYTSFSVHNLAQTI